MPKWEYWLEAFIRKLSRPEIVVLNMVLTWLAVVILSLYMDFTFKGIQDYINENVRYAPHIYTMTNITSVELP